MISTQWCKAVTLALLIALLGILCSSCSQSEQAKEPGETEETQVQNGFAAFLADGLYADAIAYYYDSISGNSWLESQAEESLLGYISQTIDKVYSGEYDEKMADAAFNTVDRVASETGLAYTQIGDFRQALDAAFASKSAYATGKRLQEAESYLAAALAFQEVSESDFNYNDAHAAAETCFALAKTAELEKAKSKATNGRYAEAIAILRTLTAQLPGPDDAVDSQIAVYEQMLVQTALSEAEAAFVTPATDYYKALDILNIALQELPEHTELIEKKAYFASFQPVNLYQLTPYLGSLYQVDSDTDILETTYQNCFFCSQVGLGTSEYSATYDISRSYNTLTATIYGKDAINETYFYTLIISGDGVRLYEKTDIPGNGKPFEISVDVTGVSDLKIEMKNSSDRTYIGYGMTDVLLQKTVR